MLPTLETPSVKSMIIFSFASDLESLSVARPSASPILVPFPKKPTLISDTFPNIES